MHRAAEVAQHDVARCDHAFRRVVVRARGVGPGGDDGEVGALVAGVEHPLDELPVHVDLAAAGEALGAHGFGDRVHRVRRGAQRIDLGRVLDDAERPGDVDGAAEARARQRVLEVDDEARPRVVADGGARRAAPTRSATTSIGSSVSSHARIENASGCSTTRGASSRGTTSTASPSAGSTSMVSRSSGIAS